MRFNLNILVSLDVLQEVNLCVRCDIVRILWKVSMHQMYDLSMHNKDINTILSRLVKPDVKIHIGP